MSIQIQYEIKNYSIQDFVYWHDSGLLELSPNFQRNEVWSVSMQNHLIDTLLQGLPIPQIFIRERVDFEVRAIRREVVDGQQRLGTIIKFVTNQLQLNEKYQKVYGIKFFSDLEEEDQLVFTKMQLGVYNVTNVSDEKIYEIFNRLNQGVPLNAQERRNSEVGEFQIICNTIADKYRVLFSNNQIFNTKEFSRMLDVELVVRLFFWVLQEGSNVKKQSPTNHKLDTLYKIYKEENQITQKFKIARNRIEDFLIFFPELLNEDWGLRFFISKIQNSNTKRNHIEKIFRLFLSGNIQNALLDKLPELSNKTKQQDKNAFWKQFLNA